MSGPGQVDAWHKAGVANGGTLGGAGQLYLAYL
jgi:hypothetical protein